jgi:hypothetical protein
MGNPTEVPGADVSPVTPSHALPAKADPPDASLTSKSAEDVSGSTPSKDADSAADVEKQGVDLGGPDTPASESRKTELPSHQARDETPIAEHYGTKEVSEENETGAGETKQTAEVTAEGEQETTRKYMSGLPLVLLTFGLCMVAGPGPKLCSLLIR